MKYATIMRTSTYKKLQKCVSVKYLVRHRNHHETGDDVNRKHREPPFLYAEKEKTGDEDYEKIQNDQFQPVYEITEASSVEL